MKGRMRTGVWKVRERWSVRGMTEGGCGQTRKPGVVKFGGKREWRRRMRRLEETYRKRKAGVRKGRTVWRCYIHTQAILYTPFQDR